MVPEQPSYEESNNPPKNGCYLILKLPEISLENRKNELEFIDMNNWCFILPENEKTPSDCLFTFGDPISEEDDPDLGLEL